MFFRVDINLQLLTFIRPWEDEKPDWRWLTAREPTVKLVKWCFGWFVAQVSEECAKSHWLHLFDFSPLCFFLQMWCAQLWVRCPRSMVTLKSWPRGSWWRSWKASRRTRTRRKTRWTRFGFSAKVVVWQKNCRRPITSCSTSPVPN